MPQYVVVNMTTGVIPADGAFGTADVLLTTQTSEQAAAQFAADLWNVKSGAALYATLTSNFGTHTVSRTVT